MLKTQAKQLIDFFESNKTPKHLKEAWEAMGQFVTLRITGPRVQNKATPKSHLLISGVGVSEEDAAKGYCATLCAQIEDPKDPKDPNECYVFQELHITKKQLEGLHSTIGFFWKRCAIATSRNE